MQVQQAPPGQRAKPSGRLETGAGPGELQVAAIFAFGMSVCGLKSHWPMTPNSVLLLRLLRTLPLQDMPLVQYPDSDPHICWPVRKEREEVSSLRDLLVGSIPN